jgi:heme A synthase
MNRRPFFGTLSITVLLFNLAVILWGAFVRATGSGAGCGDHWPTCNGEVVPRPRDLAMLIEFTHRATSGLALVGVFFMLVFAFRTFKPGHPARLGAGLSAIFILTEALLGAALVLFRLVAHDTSSARAWVHALHLVNTFALLAALTLSVWWAHGYPYFSLHGRRHVAFALGVAGALMSLLAVTGGIAALGDTLFPSHTLAEGIAQDFSPGAHILLQLRVWHPVVACASGAYLLPMAWWIRSARRTTSVARCVWALTVLYAAQLSLGVLNLYLLAPIALQIAHLFLADLVWIALVSLGATALFADE